MEKFRDLPIIYLALSPEPERAESGKKCEYCSRDAAWKVRLFGLTVYFCPICFGIAFG